MSDKKTLGWRIAQRLQELGLCVTQPTDLLAKLIDEEVKHHALVKLLGDTPEGISNEDS